MARSIGLDVGNRRIGVAVSDTLKVIARPLDVIDRKRQDALQSINQLVKSQLADEVIVGYPWNADGSAGSQARQVEAFVAQLRALLDVPIHLCDERYSTGEAIEILETRRRKDRVAHEDAIAAAVILQRYLDQLHPIESDQLEEEDHPATE
ncbi:MAG: Holliday junction resolvase RuvX [Chloroflexi bacterium]|nr:Holliday junction resolvase RuvX [Chloroflexota bacterium]MCL5273686.1 Holliday junction resolvase RuvX [Chloroflexota bacterium]